MDISDHWPCGIGCVQYSTRGSLASCHVRRAFDPLSPSAMIVRLLQPCGARLSILYTKILDVLAEIPKNAAYRKYTEQITNEKLAMVKAEPDVKKLEDQLQGGQLEEVILQAEHELSLARKMRDWKPWEPLVEEPPADQWKWPI
ncbi:NADH dehydrogenase [ubiquinone] 1 alpha subcomplex subunit 5 isoform X1 [Macaca nemestrina]|uniref:NADH dehydrogenase [ubiquinone] 1 alpha subcomplex subunit 5 isoform X1 n=1 Tax=Macaca nemestrina TaxID=9545 RepID=UPI0039B987DC